MLKKLMIVLVFLPLFVKCYSQNSEQDRSILIYSDGQGFLQPFIESTIRNLTWIGDDNLTNSFTKNYFHEVNSLNTYISDNKYQAFLRDLLDTQLPSDVRINPYYTNQEQKVRERIFNILTEYDYFLVVKTNVLEQLIEFQFQLFRTSKYSARNEVKSIPMNISDQVIGTENFFINPNDEDYRDSLKNAIHRLFKNSNNAPIAYLRIFDEPVKTGDTVKIPLNSEIILDGSNSGDYDSPSIQYIWNNIVESNEMIQTTNKVAFTKNARTQKIIINKLGKYRIGFKVFDGIQHSKEIIIELETVIKPRVLVSDTLLSSINFKSIFKPYNTKKLYQHNVYFEHGNKNDELENRILITKEKLGNKFNEVKDQFKIDSTSQIFLSDEDYDYITINSTFPKAPTSYKRRIYLYSMSKFKLLSPERVITHKLSNRGIFNFNLKSNFSIINTDQNDSNSDEEVTSSFSTFLSLNLGLFLTRNLEIQMSVPFDSKLHQIQDIKLRHPAVFEGSLNYHLYLHAKSYGSLTNIYTGILYRSYAATLNNEDISNQNGLGYKFGAQIRILDRKDLMLDALLEGSFSRIFDSEYDLLNSTIQSIVSFGVTVSY